MNSKIKDILEKYNPEKILQPLLENYDSTTIKGGDFVVIDPAALQNEDIAKELIQRKGSDYFKNLQILAKRKQPMLVSALKTLRKSSSYIAGPTSENSEEADLVAHEVPGLYRAPITVPVSIIKRLVASNNIMQFPIDDQFVQKNKETRAETLPNEYNKGKQPKGTRKNGGNN